MMPAVAPINRAHELRRTDLGPVANEGARRCWLHMAARGWDQSRVRAELKKQGDEITSGALVKYLYCDRRPGIRWGLAFQRLFGIELGAWCIAPVEPFAPPAAKERAA